MLSSINHFHLDWYKGYYFCVAPYLHSDASNMIKLIIFVSSNFCFSSPSLRMSPSGTAMVDKNGSRFRLSAKPVIIFAHLLVIVVTTLILVWLLNFREGIAFRSRTKEKIFNVFFRHHCKILVIFYNFVQVLIFLDFISFHFFCSAASPSDDYRVCFGSWRR